MHIYHWSNVDQEWSDDIVDEPAAVAWFSE